MTPPSGSQPPKSNFARVLAILAAFDAANTPRSASGILAEIGIGRSTGFALIRALVRAGLIDRADHGLIKLGAGARDLAFHPLGTEALNPAAHKRFKSTEAPMRPSNRQPIGGWDPALFELVDASVFARPAPWRIGFANAATDNPWRLALVQNIAYAARLRGADLCAFQRSDADNDPKRQAEQIRAFLRDGVDGVLLSAAPDPNDVLSGALAEAKRFGVPVVAVDRRPKDRRAVEVFVTASDDIIGRTSAVWLAEHLGGKGRIWMLSGLEGASPALRRKAAAQEVFADFPEIKVAAARFTGWTEAGGQNAVSALLNDRQVLPDGVWCDSGLQGVGSIETFLSRGLQPPPHTGGDLNRMYKLALTRDVPFAAVDYPATMGGRALETLLGLLSGSTSARRVEAPAMIVLPRGLETASVKADRWAELHVRWDLPDEAVLSQGPSLKPRHQGHKEGVA